MKNTEKKGKKESKAAIPTELAKQAKALTIRQQEIAAALCRSRGPKPRAS